MNGKINLSRVIPAVSRILLPSFCPLIILYRICTEPSYKFRCSLLPLYVHISAGRQFRGANSSSFSLVNYSRLVMYSFGFQFAFEKRVEVDLRHFYTKCFGAATSVIRTMIEDLAPSGFMLYSPDGKPLPLPHTLQGLGIDRVLIGHFVFTSFASAFLLKVSTG